MNDSLNFSNRVTQNYSLLTKKEKEIASFILENQSQLKKWNIKDLAKLNQTSNATISRFCSKLDYNSFGEFKAIVSQESTEISVPLKVPLKIASYYNQLIQSAYQLMEPSKLTAFIEAIKQANKILIIGIGNSGLSALEMKYRLTRMGLNVDAVTDPHMMLMEGALLKQKDLVIAISNFGKTTAIIDTCKIAKKEKALVCCLTNQNHTPLTEISDIILFASDKSSIPDQKFINSQLPIHYVLDVLCYILLEEEEHLNNRIKTLSAINLE